MGDGVAQVQHLPEPRIPLIVRHDPHLRVRARRDHRWGDRIGPVPHAAPELASRDQRGLDDLRVSGRQLRLGKARQQRGVGKDGRGLVIGADVVLGLGQVDAGFAPVGGVNLRDQRGRHLCVGHPALICGRAKSREVADHPSTEGDHQVFAGHPRARQLAPDYVGVGDRLGLLARHDRDRASDWLEQMPVQSADGAVSDDDALNLS